MRLEKFTPIFLIGLLIISGCGGGGSSSSVLTETSIISTSVSVNEDNAEMITLPGSGTIYTIENYPLHGTLVGTPPNLTYIPDADYIGTDSFTFSVDGSSPETVSITVNDVNGSVLPVAPIAIGYIVTLNENTSANTPFVATDANDGTTLTYILVTAPTNGTLVSGVYTPNANYNGSDSFTYKANDGTADSATVTVSITVLSANQDPNTIYITQDYEVYQLGKGTSINKRVQVDTTAKSLYILLTNASATVSDTVSISHSAKVSTLKKSVSLTPTRKIKNKYNIVATPTYIQNFRNTIKDKLILNNSKISSVLPSLSIERLSKDTAGSSVQTFYLDLLSSGVSTQATARKVVSNISTVQGTKTLNIWVSDDSFDSGSGCVKARCITQSMVDAFADTFLKVGTDNDIYDWVTNIFGSEWGSDASAKYSNLIAANNEITILLTDIDNDNSINGGTLGYFYPKDNFTTTTYSGSNERIMFYIDSVLFAKEDDGQLWSVDAVWPKEMISTLAHEFQHMIHYYEKGIIIGVDTVTWVNEMLSETTEDVIATKIHHTGSRGVSYTDGSAGSPGNIDGRYPLFNASNTLSLTEWQNRLEDYSKVNAFGTFLTRNYGGSKILHDIVYNNFSDESAVIDAIGKTVQGSGKVFDDILREWGIAVLLSDNQNLQNQPVYNTGDFTLDTYGNTTYELGSINFFNYDPLPTIYTVSGTVNPQANYYYKIGDNITGIVDINITLNSTTEATLIVK